MHAPRGPCKPFLAFDARDAAAFAIDFSIFKKVSWVAVILAVPGICVATGLTAVVVKLCYPEFIWETALLLGGILSATDPVAVVALLREMGAKKSHRRDHGS